MYQTMTVTQVNDIEILEEAFSCLVMPDHEKKDFWDQQVREALDRLRESLHRTETAAKYGMIEKEEYVDLFDMLMRGDEKFFLTLEGVFYRAEQNRDWKISEIKRGAQEILENLYEDIGKNYDFFPLYFEKDEINLTGRSNAKTTEEILTQTRLAASQIFHLVKRFKLETDSQLIRRVAEFAWRNVEKNISLEKIADTFYVNKSYLSHLFKQETGRTFVSYFTQIRMLRSRVLLRNHYKVYECAMHLGYEDAEYFSRVFKNYYGCKPTEFLMQEEVGQ